MDFLQMLGWQGFATLVVPPLLVLGFTWAVVRVIKHAWKG